MGGQSRKQPCGHALAHIPTRTSLQSPISGVPVPVPALHTSSIECPRSSEGSGTAWAIDAVPGLHAGHQQAAAIEDQVSRLLPDDLFSCLVGSHDSAVHSPHLVTAHRVPRRPISPAPASSRRDKTRRCRLVPAAMAADERRRPSHPKRVAGRGS
ncbi:unnamed protein product [Diplocarpon coronariae]|nr:hypothetical protein JHW43_006687 [Diplocarpon mali]